LRGRHLEEVGPLMDVVVHIAAVFGTALLFILIFVTIQAVVGNRGRFRLATLLLLVTLLALFIVVIQIAMRHLR
jgi:hypothetical protein